MYCFSAQGSSKKEKNYVMITMGIITNIPPSIFHDAHFSYNMKSIKIYIYADEFIKQAGIMNNLSSNLDTYM